MTTSTFAWLTTLSALASLGLPLAEGCKEAEQPTFPVLQSEPCAGGTCGAAPVVNLGSTSSNATGGAGGNTGGSSGAAGAANGSTNSISVTVGVISDPSVVTATGTYTKSANIIAPTPSSVAAGVWNGTSPVQLDKVATGKEWVSVKPLTDSTTLGTLSLIDIPVTPTPAVIKLPVVNTDAFTPILSQVNTNTTLDASAAHAVVTFVDAQSKPLAGVTVSLNLTAQVLYDGSDTKTGARGVAYLLNITGAGTITTTLTYTKAGAANSASAELHLQNGLVSILPVTLTN